MIHTWFLDVTPLMKEEELYKMIYEAVPEIRKQKAEQKKHLEARAQSLGAWWLLMEMRRAYGFEESAVFNLSHSGNYALCSLTDEDICLGCDIETLKPAKMKIASRYFCKEEKEAMERAANMDEGFCRIWVLKESFMKAVRLGLGLDMREFEINFDGEDRPFLKKKPEEFSGEYFYREYESEGVKAKISVCAGSDKFGDFREYCF